MLITKSDEDAVGIHTVDFSEAPADRSQFIDYAKNHPDGLVVARGAPGNLFVTPYNDLHDENIAYMFSRWVAEEPWDRYAQHRLDISPDWMLPQMAHDKTLRMRELDCSPTKKTTQALFYGAPEGTICNIHYWQFEDSASRDDIYETWSTDEGLAKTASFAGNITVSAFEAIDKENQFVIVSAWEHEEFLRTYLKMRRDSADDHIQPFYVDETMVQGTIADPDLR